MAGRPQLRRIGPSPRHLAAPEKTAQDPTHLHLPVKERGATDTEPARRLTLAQPLEEPRVEDGRPLGRQHLAPELRDQYARLHILLDTLARLGGSKLRGQVSERPFPPIAAPIVDRAVSRNH